MLNFKQGKTTNKMWWRKARRKSYCTGDISKKIICSTCRANRTVCIINMTCSKTVAFTSI